MHNWQQRTDGDVGKDLKISKGWGQGGGVLVQDLEGERGIFFFGLGSRGNVRLSRGEGRFRMPFLGVG